MSAPNIVNVSSIVAGWTAIIPTNTLTNIMLANLTDSGSVVKVNSLVITNVSDQTVGTSVSMNNAANGSGVSYRIAYNIYVPPNASLQLVDKGNFLYVTENTSVLVSSTIPSALEYVGVYETIS
jgi:hypothetical protein